MTRIPVPHYSRRAWCRHLRAQGARWSEIAEALAIGELEAARLARAHRNRRAPSHSVSGGA